jgi:hypothetical protein
MRSDTCPRPLPCSHIVPSATASAICISFNVDYTVYTLLVSRTLTRPSRSLSMTRPCVQWRLCRLSLEDICRTSPRATGRTEDLDYQSNSPGIELRRRRSTLGTHPEVDNGTARHGPATDSNCITGAEILPRPLTRRSSQIPYSGNVISILVCKPSAGHSS